MGKMKKWKNIQIVFYNTKIFNITNENGRGDTLPRLIKNNSTQRTK